MNPAVMIFGAARALLHKHREHVEGKTAPRLRRAEGH
jgi:hypothetical protein